MRKMKRTFTYTELSKILENHKHWLAKDCDNWRTMKADLKDADLSGADLRNANLSGADLRNANLKDADLYHANLTYAELNDTILHNTNLNGADLSGAILNYVNLYGAHLKNADLSCTKLYCANLERADLCGANLSYADLYHTNLSYSVLYQANLSWTDLSYANLYCANLCNANLCDAMVVGLNLHKAFLRGVENMPFIPYACPDFGKFIGFKKAYYQSEPYIVVLEIPEDAKRLSATGRKCRCDKAKVIEFQNLDGSKADVECVYSKFDKDFKYEIGKTVFVNDFCEDRWDECSQGIHFFINRQEAVNY